MSTQIWQTGRKPFRWNLAAKSELGRLVDENYDLNSEFLGKVRHCSANIVAQLNPSYVVFVGRSLESINSYLSGIVKSTFWDHSMVNLNISLYNHSITDIRTEGEVYVNALKSHFSAIGVHPEEILRRSNVTTFVDVVHCGSTFGRIFEFIKQWATGQSLDLPAVKRKLKFLGVTSRSKSSPNTWRWEQHAKWVDELPKGVSNISVDRRFWSYIANHQGKMTESVTLEKWLSSKITSPSRKEGNIKALNQAYSLYCLGRDKKERRLFSKALAMKNLEDNFHRKLILEIKGL